MPCCTNPCRALSCCACSVHLPTFSYLHFHDGHTPLNNILIICTPQHPVLLHAVGAVIVILGVYFGNGPHPTQASWCGHTNTWPHATRIADGLVIAHICDGVFAVVRTAAHYYYYYFFPWCSHLQRWKASGLSATEPPVLETQDVVVAKPNDQECIITVKSRWVKVRRHPLCCLTFWTAPTRVLEQSTLRLVRDRFWGQCTWKEYGIWFCSGTGEERFFWDDVSFIFKYMSAVNSINLLGISFVCVFFCSDKMEGLHYTTTGIWALFSPLCETVTVFNTSV